MTIGPQFLRFLAVGLVNTAVGLGMIFALKALAGWGDIQANIAGYAAGLVTSFVLNRRWTFMHDGDWSGALLRFVAVFAIAYAANLLLLLHLRDGWGVNAYLAHALATVPYTLLFFAGSRWFAFKSRGLQPRAAP